MEPVREKSLNDVVRKKLEAELRATEEIARIKQSVIEKRLAVELAALEEPRVAAEESKTKKAEGSHKAERSPTRTDKIESQTSWTPSVTRSAGHTDVEAEILKQPTIEAGESESEDEMSNINDDHHGKKRGSFFKGVFRKLAKRMKSEERRQQDQDDASILSRPDGS